MPCLRHDEHLVEPLRREIAKTNSKTTNANTYKVEQTYPKWNNDSGDNSTIDGLGTTGFELTTPTAS